MIRNVTVIITQDSRVEFAGDDLPDLEELEALVGEQPVDEALRAIGLDTKLNTHLCG